MTTREQQMAVLVMHGFSNKEIARKLCISPITVRETLKKAMRKLNIANRTQLGVWAYASHCQTANKSRA